MYDNDKIVTYTWENLDFGEATGDEIRTFRFPPGYQGDLIQIGASITETFANTAGTTASTVEIGTIADPDAYGLLTIAIGAADKDFYDQTDDTDAIISHTGTTQEAQIAADSIIALKTVGGSASAGKAIPVASFRIWK